ncbi:MAG: phage portal protein [Phycisphaerales bacterium]
MPYTLSPFAPAGLTEALLKLLVEEHRTRALPAMRRLWRYYRNPAESLVAAGGGAGGRRDACPTGVRPRLAQESGLPSRITGEGDPWRDDRAWKREAVVENDIGWRVQLMVDFMFGKPVQIASTAPDERRRREIEAVLDAVWERSGGIALLQDMALLGHVYGHVDLVLRVEQGAGSQGGRGLTAPSPASPSSAAPFAAADAVRVEVVEPTRGIPVLDPGDYRTISAYIITFERELNEVERGRAAVGRAIASLWRTASDPGPRRRRSCFTEVLSATHRQVYEDERLIGEEELTWNTGDSAAGGTPAPQVPVVHIQNVSQPFRYGGLGEVEPLIPLQDELNTRLSDRAARVTLQSFKMYLAKGLDGFDRMPVGPGQVWRTDNPDASVEAFGGDMESPSETAHIQEVREAMDKTSGVPPLASGVVRAKIGNLTSANALRITLMGVLSRTARKRVTYGRGIAEMSRLILGALDATGVFATTPEERGVRLIWPDPLPEDVREQAAAAAVKSTLGVPRERVLAELGYSPADPGVT